MSNISTPWKTQWRIKRDAPEDHGGQGTVVQLCSKTDPKLRAVLKRIVERWKDNSEARERLAKEAEILSKLHEIGGRVPAVYDSFLQHQEAEPFIIMEFIPGILFDQWLKTTAPVTPAEAARITLSIAETVELCHKHNIGHRDIKPRNIILRDGDATNPYVLDFGISFDSRQTMALTQEGEIFWNEFITLPECQDQEGGHRDLRSDVTALVGIFFNCITGRRPIVLHDAKELAPHQRHQDLIISLAERPEEGERLLWLFDKGFAYRIDDRFQGLDEFRAELEYFANPTAESTLDLRTAFDIFDQSIQRSDRNVQLGSLRTKYKSVSNSMHKSVTTLLSSFKNGSGQVHQFPLSKVPDVSKPTMDGGDLLDRQNAWAYYLMRDHYEKAACALLVAFGVDMDIHLYAASGIVPTNNVLNIEGPLTWSKIAVIDETQDALSDSKLSVIVQAVGSRIAREIGKLTPQYVVGGVFTPEGSEDDKPIPMNSGDAMLRQGRRRR